MQQFWADAAAAYGRIATAAKEGRLADDAKAYATDAAQRGALRILPPEGVEADERKRPFMIVEPRSGLGAGIGGFSPTARSASRCTTATPCIFPGKMKLNSSVGLL